MFHQHQWVTTGAKFHAPNGGPISLKGISAEEALIFCAGFTNVTQTCKTCGRVATHMQPGAVDVQVREREATAEALPGDLLADRAEGSD